MTKPVADLTRTFKVDPVAEKRFSWHGEVTDKVAAVMRMFGVDLDRLKRPPAAVCKCRIELRPGDICYITGPSGSGKSVLLQELYAAADESERINLDGIDLPNDRSLVDCIDGNFFEALSILSKAGLNDVFCVLNRPGRLSDGQKYRFRLAKALQSAGGGPRAGHIDSIACACATTGAGNGAGKIVFADEFCSALDRITAAVVAYNVRRFATRHKVMFILASSHDDILTDLAPEVLVVKNLTGKTEVIYKDIRRQTSEDR